MKYLSQKDFSKEDSKYQLLLRKELHYCNVNRDKIIKLANKAYKLGLKEKTRNQFNICNFKKVEEKYLEFIQDK